MAEAGPYRVAHHDSLGSTNDEAMARLRAGDPGGLFVVARSQTGGRGRQGRHWVSPSGNLYATLALRAPSAAAVAPQLGFVAGVALAQALRGRLSGDTRLAIKWPNDAVFAGAKIAGILLESAILPGGDLGCVVGIGVNCMHHPGELPYPATDLRAIGDVGAEPAAVLADLGPALSRQLAVWDRGAGFAKTRATWLSLAAGLGGRIAVATPRQRLEGTFRDLDPDGRLLVDTPGGLVAVDAGDVFLAGATADAMKTKIETIQSDMRKVL